ncbi:F1F0 ATP synthase subunit e, mitochondrial [Entomophthora muscae]|uniref:F1F0 ATP synthase subunit e, mitochondrial n=1 Tax=Entomophthora muscae TaxID=34485 RepID=A0ACC2STK1_9FUNG|nr:F1F0 ATP synthase subunit e, mitochondrial [Entomophthora muscae]
MSASIALINSLRWGGLVFGVGYGFVHHRTLAKQDALKREHDAIKHKENLIRQAKKEFARKQAALSSAVVSDPTSPDFDLEKYLKSIEKSQ